MQPWTAPAPHAAPPMAASPAAPAFYVPIPRRLAADLRNSLVALGVFALLARVFRATSEPVPLSAADLRAFDPSLSHGAATHALQRLVAAGWLLPERRPGRKTTYTPAWGRVSGAALPWDLAAPSLGRPRHIAALRLDQALLDVCMGRLEPHPDHPATVRRYLETPLLGLREVGAYALALAGLPVASPALAQLGFLAAGQPLPLPGEATILAVASQRAALTPAGWRRTPFGPPPAPAPATDQALFFVPPDQIGPMIGGEIAHLIPDEGTEETSLPASERPEARLSSPAATSHGVMQKDGEDSTTPSTPAQTRPGGGGRSFADREPQTGSRRPGAADREPQTGAQPANNDTACLLQAAGVRRSVAVSLATRPSALVARVIAQARARSDVRDLAGWVVAALRDLPDNEPAPPERPLSALPIHTHPDLTDEQRDRWIWRFRAAATPAEQRAILERLAQEHPQ